MILFALSQKKPNDRQNKRSKENLRGKVSKRSSSHPLYGAVLYLVNKRRQLWPRGDRLCGLAMSLNSLEKKWLPNNPYPVILMSETGWSNQTEMRQYRTLWPTIDFFFLDIKSYFEIHSDSDVFEDHASPLSDLDYKRMCSFMWNGWLDVPLLKDVRFIMRIDDDSCILNSINYDMFHEMEKRNSGYGYNSVSQDYGFVTKGLYDYVKSYVRENNIVPANMDIYNRFIAQNSTGSFPMANTNFEIFDTMKFRSPSVSAFINSVVKSENIFHRRWGDAPLRYALLMLFFGPDEVFRVCDFIYQHSSWDESELCHHRTHRKGLQWPFE